MSERGVNILATALVGGVLMIAMLALVLLTSEAPAETPAETPAEAPAPECCVVPV